MKLILTSLFGYFFTLYIAKLDFGGDNEKDLEYLIRASPMGFVSPENRQIRRKRVYEKIFSCIVLFVAFTRAARSAAV
jgi:hypothetical protein